MPASALTTAPQGSHFANQAAASRAIDIVMPAIAAAMADTRFGESSCLHIVVMDPARRPGSCRFEEEILCERSLGRPESWDADYAGMARQGTPGLGARIRHPRHTGLPTAPAAARRHPALGRGMPRWHRGRDERLPSLVRRRLLLRHRRMPARTGPRGARASPRRPVRRMSWAWHCRSSRSKR